MLSAKQSFSPSWLSDSGLARRTAPGHARGTPPGPPSPPPALAGRKPPPPARQAPYWWAPPRQVQKISVHAYAH